MDLVENEIRKIAHELYEKSGKIAGQDLDNWLEAERIIKRRRCSYGKEREKRIGKS